MKLDFSNELLVRFLIIFSALSALSLADVFPSIMEGEYAVDNFYTVELMIGTPPRSVRLAVDFSSTGITTAIPFPVVSRSFSPALGGSEIVHFEDNNIRMNLQLDGGANARSLGCSDCEGTIGIGAGSNIWLYYKRGIFTPGSTVLDEDLTAYSRQLDGTEGEFNCLPGFPNLCVTETNVKISTGFKRDKPVGKISGLVRIMFGKAVQKTVVPAYLYHAFTQGRNVQKNPDPDEWPDIEFTIPTAPSEGGGYNKFEIKSDDIITRSRRTGFDLLLEPGSDNFTVILSRSASRSFLLRRDWHTGKGQVVPWCAKKHWPSLSLAVMLITSIIYVYWKVSPSAEWKAQGQATTYGPIWKLLVSCIGTLLSIVIYASPATQDAFKAHLDLNIYFGTLIFITIAWQAFGSYLYICGGAKRLLGYHAIPIADITSRTTSPKKDEKNKMSRHQQQKQKNQQKQIRINTNSKSLRHNYDIERQHLYTGGQHYHPLTENIQSFNFPYPASSRVPKKYIYLSPRLWILLNLSNETLLLATLFLVFVETRVETLGNFFTVILIFMLLFNILYYIMVDIFVSIRVEPDGRYFQGINNRMFRSQSENRSGTTLYNYSSSSPSYSSFWRYPRWSFFWTLFWFWISYILVSGLILAQFHIIRPFIERHVSRFPRTIEYTTVFVYGVGLLLAIYWARHRVIYEEQTRFKLIQKYIKSQ